MHNCPPKPLRQGSQLQPMSRQRFERTYDSLRRHGLGNVVLRACYRHASRLFEFEWCRVESSSMQPYDWPAPANCDTRIVCASEFFANLCAELADTNVHWAFERGDQCTANFIDGQIVGYSFTSTAATRVRDGLLFEVPKPYTYVFAAITATAHRGKRLARERWKVGRAAMLARSGVDRPRVWYINAINRESRAAGRRSGGSSVLHVYSGYFRLFGRWLTYRSPAARRFGAGFVRPTTHAAADTETYESPATQRG